MKNQTQRQQDALNGVRNNLKSFKPTSFSVQLKNINRNRDHIIVVEWVNGPTQSEIEEKVDMYGNWSNYDIDFIRYNRKYTAHFLLSVLLQFCIKNNIPTNSIEITGDENDSHFFCSVYSMYYELSKELNDILNNLNGKYVKDIYAERETAYEKAERLRKEEEEKANKAKKEQEEWVKNQRAKEEAELNRKNKEAKEKAEKAEKERKEQEEKAKKSNKGWDTNGNGKSEYKEDFKSWYNNYQKKQEDQSKYEFKFKQEAPKQNTTTAKKMPSFFWNKIDALTFLGLPVRATDAEIKKQFFKIVADCKFIDTVTKKESFKEYKGYQFDMDCMVRAKEAALNIQRAKQPLER